MNKVIYHCPLSMISVIIPTHNEAGYIAALVNYLYRYGAAKVAEVIVCDYKSTDATLANAAAAGAKTISSTTKGRASQMNLAASVATSNILYFVHADTFPPKNFATAIEHAVKNGYDIGRCRTRFLSKHPLLKVNAFFTRFDMFSCYGGDQTLFTTSALFKQIGGFDVTKLIMEDYDITTRARKKGRYIILRECAEVSARKYRLNSWLQVQRANFMAVQLYKKGTPTSEIIIAYRKMLKY